MTTNKLNEAPLLVVGAGVMGVGIAQVAAQAGHAVMLHDAREGAAAESKTQLARSLDALVALDAHCRGERYRVSPWLWQRAWQEGVQ